MGKSKNGGTRSYIRGRVGADVYSIGRDAKGKKQQIVRSLAESVANPQTLAQMRGRMIMSSVMQAVAALKPIIDHSFDGFTGRQPNISKFIADNYALVKADVATNPSSGNKFGLNAYLEKGVKRGQYLISDGKAVLPAALVLTQGTGVIAITMDAENVSVAGLKAALGLNSEEYFTLVGINSNGFALYERFRINPNMSDTSAISAENIAAIFATEGNADAAVSVQANVISIALAEVATCCAVIISKQSNGGFIHNRAILGDGNGFAAPASVALPTYPVGNNEFLNGGDINGGQESIPGGDDIEPEVPFTLQASALSVGGTTRNVGYREDSTTFPLTRQVAITLTGEPLDGSAKIVSKTGDGAYAPGDTLVDFTVLENVSSLSVERTITAQGSLTLYLLKPDNKVVQSIYSILDQRD